MLIPALFALFNACRAQGRPTIDEPTQRRVWLSHTGWLILAFILIDAQTLSLSDTLAGMWIVVVMTILPPNVMFSAITGRMPGRSDGSWQWMQDLAFKLTSILPHKWAFYDLGIVYGVLKGSLAIPAILWLGNPVLWLLLLHGLFLFVFGAKWVRVVDMIIGLIIGCGI